MLIGKVGWLVKLIKNDILRSELKVRVTRYLFVSYSNLIKSIQIKTKMTDGIHVDMFFLLRADMFFVFLFTFFL